MNFYKKDFLREKMLSKHWFIMIVCAILWSCLLLVGLIYKQSEQYLVAARESYRYEAHGDALEVKRRLENTFRLVYQNIRTISKLPSVRTIGRHAETLSESDRISIQEIYNNLKNNVNVSEVYVLPKDFNPHAIDPVTGKPEEPIISFDELIVGRTADDYMQHEKHTSPVEEVEEYEYRLMSEQLAWFKQHYPTIEKIAGFNFPAITGREVITCDNSHFSPAAPNDADRSGIVYSLPFYDMEGHLKGQISAIFLTHVLRGGAASGELCFGQW